MILSQHHPPLLSSAPAFVGEVLLQGDIVSLWPLCGKHHSIVIVIMFLRQVAVHDCLVCGGLLRLKRSVDPHHTTPTLWQQRQHLQERTFGDAFSKMAKHGSMPSQSEFFAQKI